MHVINYYKRLDGFIRYAVKYKAKKDSQTENTSHSQECSGANCHEAECYCCGLEKISRANFAAGHIDAEATGGDVTLDNLRPICTLCNSSMGRANMRQFILTYRLRGKFATEIQGSLELEGTEVVNLNSKSEAEIPEINTPETSGNKLPTKKCPFCQVSIANMSTHEKTIRHLEAVMNSVASELPAAQEFSKIPGVSSYALFFTQYGKAMGDAQLYQQLIEVARKIIYPKALLQKQTKKTKAQSQQNTKHKTQTQ